MKKDNGSLGLKINVRKRLMDRIAPLAILETHGGSGGIYRRLYSEYRGMTIEMDLKKAAALAEQRPHWAVYCGDAVKLVGAGCGFHLPVNFVDIDPYGSPWEILEALFSVSERLPDRFGIAVNDGLKRYFQVGGAYKFERMTPYVERLGNDAIAGMYPEICRDMIEGMAGAVGLSLDWWFVCSGGHGGQMTHYAAVLVRAG
jgi:hypothetical protein